MFWTTLNFIRFTAISFFRSKELWIGVAEEMRSNEARNYIKARTDHNEWEIIKKKKLFIALMKAANIPLLSFFAFDERSIRKRHVILVPWYYYPMVLQECSNTTSRWYSREWKREGKFTFDWLTERTLTLLLLSLLLIYYLILSTCINVENIYGRVLVAHIVY